MFNTTYSHNTHLRQSATCKYWMSYSKTRQIEEPSITANVEDFSSRLQDFGHAADDFEIGEAGPGPTTVEGNRGLKRMLGRLPHSLNVAESQWYFEPHKLGGQVIRMGTTLYERWRARFACNEETLVNNDDENQFYSPFASKLDWQIAQWAVQESVGQGAFDRLLKIPGVLDHLQLSFKNSRQLNKINAPADETFAVRYRDPLEAIKALWGDPSLAEHLVYKLSKMFADPEKLRRAYSEMWTGKWWWAMQSQLKQREAMIAPIILATNKTQLTQFSGSRSAYPVYLTLGNIPRHIRRRSSQQACILVAYLPVDKIAKRGLTKREHSARYSQLFYESMRFLLSPIAQVSQSGVEMVGGDSSVRRVHLIVSCYVANYPEQCLVGCSKYGTCLKCQCSKADLADMDEKSKQTQIWTTGVIDTAKITTRSVPQYVKRCMEQAVSGLVYKPFWTDFWDTNVYLALTPDVLHQLYQGVFKHLVNWCQSILSEDELDLQVRCLPGAMGARQFKKGWSALSQISGSERKHMAKLLVACLVGSAMPPKAIKACHVILNFIYLAQFTFHDEDSLSKMQSSLTVWEAHQDAFIEAGTREDFNIPKFHSLVHYMEMIRMFGSTDNYNTKMFERLHIDFVKKGWRASNKWNEFLQMTAWLTRQENVAVFNRYIGHRKCEQLENPPPPHDITSLAVAFQAKWEMHLTKHPSATRSIKSIENLHKVLLFGKHLAAFLLLHQGSPLRNILFSTLELFHTLKFTLQTDNGEEIPETVHCTSIRRDPVIVLTQDSDSVNGLGGTRIARLQVLFRLPKVVNFPGLGPFPAHKSWPTYPLASVEWYTKPTITPSERLLHGYHSALKAYIPDKVTPQWSIIPLCKICQTCMLLPNFKKSPREDDWTAQNVLDKADHFFANHLQSVQ
ncbi:hypothetical protein AAF712_010209 [Marasmius tenuissimus]|uniref:Uncharacterized protein n=1 Tax=Marasmius tenuissimus TaxID=585030 RepID=A0ABR2ZNA0_9AGAR